MTTEVEIRALLTKEKYEELLAFFHEQCNIESEDHQEIRYLKAPFDLRIQQNDYCSKITKKGGDIHDPSREEVEIECKREDFERLQQLFTALGHDIKMVWYRTRNTFEWKGITVMVDWSKGLEPVIELEMLTTPEHSAKALAHLREKLHELGIEETPVDIMKKRFENYAKNWRELTQ
jgi:predicted adenylyl cyclase CyaB